MSYVGSLIRCTTFALGLGLMPLWSALVFVYALYGRNDYYTLLSFGLLVFYGWGLCLQVIGERWGEFYSRLEKTATLIDRRAIKEMMVEAIVPFAVVGLSVSVALALIESGPSERVVALQYWTAVLGFGASAYHALRVTWLINHVDSGSRIRE